MEEKEMYFYLDDPIYYKGWTYGSHWNGFGCPRFTKQTTKKILDDLNKRYGGVQYHFDNDTLVYKFKYDEEEERLQPNEDNTYSLGAWSWTWSEISEEELKEKIWNSYEGDIVEF